MAASAQVIPFPSPSAAPDITAGSDQPVEYQGRPLSSLKTQFQNAVSSKTAENEEAAQAERYFHGVQWADKDLKVLADRGQPAVTFNRIKRKVNTVSGIIEKLKQDPKAYPRTPSQAADDSAELATQVLRYALGWDWEDKSAHAARRCSVRGISGVELVVTPGDQGDPNVELDLVDMRDFFYDPRSTKPDFSDARYLGTTKWWDLDEAQAVWPQHAEALASYVERGYASDWERGDERQKLAWLNKSERQVRIVDHWYKRGHEWHYTIYCGEIILEEGQSPHRNEKRESVSKFMMFSFEVDHDNDRYGLFRDLKSAQDEINQRRSKALHQSNNRTVWAEAGAVDDVDKARKELSRADGWVVVNPGKTINPLDAQAAAIIQGNLDMLAEAKAEIDTYGPNPGLIGTDIPAESGRAIKLLQAAGIAELGAFFMSYKHWKLRVYRQVWCAVQQFWQAPRWIRVTDSDEMQQFIQVNGWEQDEYGFPVAINALGALDVDIIIDEAGDTINTMEDTFELMAALAKNGAQIPPQALIELSNLPSSVKKGVLAKLNQQQSPQEQQAIAIKIAQEIAKLQKLESEAQLNQARAVEALNPQPTGEGPQMQVDTPADLAKARLDHAKAAEIESKLTRPEQPDPALFALNMAKVDLTRAQAAKTAVEARTIDEAPPGMLQKPPPRPPSTGGNRGA